MVLLAELNSIDEIKEDYLLKLRSVENRLNSIEVQTKFEQSTNVEAKQNFLKERNELVIVRAKLENTILEKIAERLKLLNDDLEAGISDLETALRQLDDTIFILNTIRRVTGIVARILLFV